ncbi:MAG: glycerophosphodiester phosphodiesterase [candidate division Zixibacteria bacterium]|nr:glycerophosphodiester phosphodiesterase [candidate division Zixibacteria bacterium]
MLPLIIAHRGASGVGLAPENTLAAFRLALELGADLVELDVHRTGDGRIVVIHDATLDRTTDRRGAVRDLAFSEILDADAGGGQPIPALFEVLELVRNRALALIEIKPPDITQSVIAAIRDAEASDFVVLQSFYPNVIAETLQLAPDIPRALLIGKPGGDIIRQANAVGAGVVVPAFSFVTAETIRETRLRGLAVWTYTVDAEPDMRRMIALGVDGIITNYPDRKKITNY